MTTVAKIKRLSRVEIVDDERGLGNGLIVTLAKGYSFDPFQDNRVAGADTVKELEHLIWSATKYAGPYDE